jgi:hypothetical protein
LIWQLHLLPKIKTIATGRLKIYESPDFWAESLDACSEMTETGATRLAKIV